MIPAEACPKCGAEERHFNTGWSGVGGTYSCEMQVIPAEAVEAATEALLTALASGIDGAYIQEDGGPSNCVIDGHGLDVPACVTKALQAAAPHMGVVDREGLRKILDAGTPHYRAANDSELDALVEQIIAEGWRK